ncbi:MAG TPA: hypothetical protein VH092_07375 [Urbifossiella sp.]|jgi:hypothetical protein|nr:hypothetical protein [Urbifossiella sp.]
MRYKCAATTAVLACGLVACAQDAPAEKYASKDGGYAVRFPTGAVITTKTQDVAPGLKTTITTAIDKAERRTYIVSYTPHQKGVLKSSVKAILDLGEKVTLAQPGTTRVSAKDFTFGKEKYPVREILSVRDQNETRTRFILAEPILYTLVIGGPKEFASSKEASEFLDSLEITPPGKTKAKK